MGIIEKMRLDGKVSFVTGGARGIGKQIAIALAEAGSDVAIVDVDIEEAEKTAAGIAKENGSEDHRHKDRCYKAGGSQRHDGRDHEYIWQTGCSLLQCGYLHEHPL